MAPKYKLSHFNATAPEEAIHLLFAYGGADFEDIRAERSELQSETSFEHAPLLEVDGRVIQQTRAICRYLAKQFKLAGEDEWENLLIDAVVDTVVDFRIRLEDFYFDEDAESKAKKRELLIKETIPFYMPKFEELVKKNQGYFVNGKLTWADLYFVGVLDFLNRVAQRDLLEGYPHLIQLRDTVLALPAVQDVIAKRPKVSFNGATASDAQGLPAAPWPPQPNQIDA